MIRTLLVLGLWVGLASAALAQSCDSEAACLDAYATAVVDRDTPLDPKAAGLALRQGCAFDAAAGSSGRACRILSYLVAKGVVASAPDDRRALNAKGCALGDDVACNFLANGLLTADSWETERDDAYRRDRRAIEADCATGNDFACRKLVRYVSPADAARYQDRCAAGETTFCALLGGPYLYPYFIDRAAAHQGEDIFRAACEAGNGMGCMFLADLVSSGHARDLTETQEPYMRRACDLGVAHGCNVLRDILLARDPDLPVNDRLAVLRPSCDAGFGPACLRVAALRRWDSDATKTDYAMALRADCLTGSARSCVAAAEALNAVRFRMNLQDRYDDVDQMLQNYFDFADLLAGG